MLSAPLILTSYVGQRIAEKTKPPAAAERETFFHERSPQRAWKRMALIAFGCAIVLSLFWKFHIAGLGRFARIGSIASLIVTGICCLGYLHAAPRLFRRRRKAFAWFKRLIQREFWPAWFFYVPVCLWFLALAIRYRGLSVFTAVNPGMPSGGFVGESKSAILRHFENCPEHRARFALIHGRQSLMERLTAVQLFMDQQGLRFPIVLKPDVGQRGKGVSVIRTLLEAAQYLEEHRSDTIVQEYVGGLEFGIFFARRPGTKHGRITSITRKTFPIVEGDGRRTVEELILSGERSVCMFDTYVRQLAGKCYSVLGHGERLQLVEIGSHARGAIFKDGTVLNSEALERELDKVSSLFSGFHFGRFDLRADSIEALQNGSFRILELNGVTSEPTHIYDPTVSTLRAYWSVFAHWYMAFEIGAANRASGARVTPIRELLMLIFRGQPAVQ